MAFGGGLEPRTKGVKRKGFEYVQGIFFPKTIVVSVKFEREVW